MTRAKEKHEAASREKRKNDRAGPSNTKKKGKFNVSNG